MKLYILDNSEDTWYEIKDVKYFEEDMSIEDLKELYQNMFADIFIQNLLDELEEEKKIESTLSKEERVEDRENWNNYRYTMQYIKNVLESKMSVIEFKTFIDWCENDIKDKMKKANK